MSNIKNEPIDSANYQNELVTSSSGKTTIITTTSTEPVTSAAAAATTTTTTNPVESIEQLILDLCRQKADGINDLELQHNIPDITKEQRLRALNSLLSAGKLELAKNAQRGLLYRIKDVGKSSDMDENIVFSIIKASANRGISRQDITNKTNIKSIVLTKVLKSLESKRLIKLVTSVSVKRRIYMLFELEPDRSLTGGPWYNGKDIESEFVEIINQHCYNFLLGKKNKADGIYMNDPLSKRNMSYATSKEVREYIKGLGISNVDLSIDDIEALLNTLVFDGKVERTCKLNNNQQASTSSNSNDNEQLNLYRAINAIIPINIGSNLVRLPCTICPIIDQCYDDGIINPRSCIYMKDWLEF